MLATLARVDNGSMSARLFDEPGALRSILAHSPLPFEGNFEAPTLDPAIRSLLVGSDKEPNSPESDSAVYLEQRISRIVEITATINALEAERAVLMEAARREAVLQDDLLDQGSAAVTLMSSHAHYQKWLERTAVSSISAAIKMSEANVSRHANSGRELVARAPQTLAAALQGSVPWANAQVIADTVAEMPTELSLRFDAQILHAAQSKNRAELKRKAAQLRERIHPTPVEVRHSEAACARRVWTEPAADGMATLGLFAPAPAVHAIFDRLTQTAKQVIADAPHVFPAQNGSGDSHPNSTAPDTTVPGSSPLDDPASVVSEADPRTLNQLRADTLISLALDDGTLDLFAASAPVDSALTSAASGASTASAGFAVSTGSADSATAITATAASPAILDHSANYSGRNGYRGDAWDDQGPSVYEPWQTSGFQLAKIARSIRPNIFLTVPVMTLLGLTAEPALLDGVVPIDPQTARELTCLAPSLTRILTHPVSGQVLGIDATTYRPPKDFQDYITTRDTGCRFPGCVRKAANCDFDHTIEYADGGQTNVFNMALLCRAHHMLKTLGAFKLEQTPIQSANRSPSTLTAQGVQPPQGAEPLNNPALSAARLGHLVWTDPFGRRYYSAPQPIPATGHPHGIQTRPQPNLETENWELDDPQHTNPYPDEEPPF